MSDSQLSSLKKLKHLDLAENMFASIPICALRMSSLLLLDLSNNQLTDLPEAMDRYSQARTRVQHSYQRRDGGVVTYGPEL